MIVAALSPLCQTREKVCLTEGHGKEWEVTNGGIVNSLTVEKKDKEEDTKWPGPNKLDGLC